MPPATACCVLGVAPDRGGCSQSLSPATHWFSNQTKPAFMFLAKENKTERNNTHKKKLKKKIRGGEMFQLEKLRALSPSVKSIKATCSPQRSAAHAEPQALWELRMGSGSLRGSCTHGCWLGAVCGGVLLAQARSARPRKTPASWLRFKEPWKRPTGKKIKKVWPRWSSGGKGDIAVY